MLKCAYCGKDAERFGNALLINTDGDFVCNDECKRNYEIDRDKFFNEILPHDDKFEEWLNGE